MRNARIRTTAVAATALLAALSLTACQSDDDAKNPGASVSPTADRSKPAADPTSTPAGNGKGNGGSSSGSAAGAGKSKDKDESKDKGKDNSDPGPGPVTDACSGANTKVTVSKVTRPINHLLLTVTNTGSKACNAYHAPLLRFDDAQAVTQVMEDSRPQAVTTIAPGESAYASILLSSADGSGKDGYTAKRLTVHFAPRSGSGSTGTPVGLALPAGTYADSTTAVSYWQSSMQDALTY
ncbi:DUF4232 domain-containing protein [Streptomyces sp. NBC_01210]|uniref:DUF4232 domain-containing protein n=1 Tax=Streptomyces sp. NBC_01210 TaxID=2903774 RepID=UPI002E0DA4A6|nr:DUF4232 domain-containing protein [Streptomyces sp. NBC_01210]